MQPQASNSSFLKYSPTKTRYYDLRKTCYAFRSLEEEQLSAIQTTQS